MSKHLAKLNFTFRKEKKLNRFWGIFRIEVSLLQINLLLLQMSDTTALRRVGIKELGEITLGGISLVVLWLRLHLPVQGLQVQFLVGELRSHMPSSERNQNISNSSNIVTNSTKTFKMAHKKKTLKNNFGTFSSCYKDGDKKETLGGKTTLYRSTY